MIWRTRCTPVTEYVLQVQFDHDAVPARCQRFERRGLNAPDQGVWETWIGATHGAHVIASDVPPGIVGMRWEWECAAPPGPLAPTPVLRTR